MSTKKPKVAVYKFSSCDGCQLSLLDCEDEILQIADSLEICHFMEMTSTVIEGPYDLTLVEGSVTTEREAKEIQDIRKNTKVLVAIGACATSGGIQALKNFEKHDDYIKLVYPKPEYIKTLATSTPISDHVKVDFELMGCPINKYQLVELCKSFIHNIPLNVSSVSVCEDCKRKNNTCVMVAYGTPCLGPVTHAGCGAICPSYNRGCYGCYGPKETANPESLAQWMSNHMKVDSHDILCLLRNFNANATSFKEVSIKYEQGSKKQ